MKKRLTFLHCTQQQYVWGLIGVLALAAFLRFYQLGLVPHGMAWDEAAIGYNGFAIFTTRRDEWLTRLPVSFWSFGDYKAPLAIYLNGIFTYVFGMNLTAVRLPFAVAGVLAVWGMILLTLKLTAQASITKDTRRLVALAAGAMLALSPWHLHFSRTAFESGLALTLFIWSTWGFLKALEAKSGWWQFGWGTLSVILFSSTLYAYHSAKIVIPLFFIFLGIKRWRFIRRYRKMMLPAALLGLPALYPLIQDSFWGQGLQRADTLLFFKDGSFWEQIILAFTNFLAHFAPHFLLFGQTTTLRHGDGQWGVLLPTTLALIIIALVWRGWRTNNPLSILFRWGSAIALLGIVPAALGTEIPHANRALLALPGFLLMAAAGLGMLLSSNRISNTVRKSLLGMLFLLHGLFSISYLHHYYTDFAAQSAADFQDGYLQAFAYAIPYEKGADGQPAVEKIIFTSDYGQPYIYALFARKTNPIWYQGGSLVKYEFTDTITIGDLDRKNTLVVASNNDDLLSRNNHPDYTVYGSDGSVRFRMYYNP